MRAMILGAGRGTRLQPLTDTVPKILVPVLGVPMLDRLRAWLGRKGVEALAMNTHHLPEAVEAHLEATPALPAVRLFHEPHLLGTGGALVNAAAFWGHDLMLVWNGDILADVAPQALLTAHTAAVSPAGRPPLATMAVQARESDSHLLVDAGGWVCGVDSARRGRNEVLRRPQGRPRPLAFDGISVVAPALRERLPPSGSFDLVDALLAAIAGGGHVHAYDAGDAFYGTTGTPEQLSALEAGLTARPGLLAAWTP